MLLVLLVPGELTPLRDSLRLPERRQKVWGSSINSVYNVFNKNKKKIIFQHSAESLSGLSRSK